MLLSEFGQTVALDVECRPGSADGLVLGGKDCAGGHEACEKTARARSDDPHPFGVNMVEDLAVLQGGQGGQGGASLLEGEWERMGVQAVAQHCS